MGSRYLRDVQSPEHNKSATLKPRPYTYTEIDLHSTLKFLMSAFVGIHAFEIALKRRYSCCPS